MTDEVAIQSKTLTIFMTNIVLCLCICMTERRVAALVQGRKLRLQYTATVMRKTKFSEKNICSEKQNFDEDGIDRGDQTMEQRGNRGTIRNNEVPNSSE